MYWDGCLEGSGHNIFCINRKKWNELLSQLRALQSWSAIKGSSVTSRGSSGTSIGIMQPGVISESKTQDFQSPLISGAWPLLIPCSVLPGPPFCLQVKEWPSPLLLNSLLRWSLLRWSLLRVRQFVKSDLQAIPHQPLHRWRAWLQTVALLAPSRAWHALKAWVGMDSYSFNIAMVNGL